MGVAQERAAAGIRSERLVVQGGVPEEGRCARAAAGQRLDSGENVLGACR